MYKNKILKANVIIFFLFLLMSNNSWSNENVFDIDECFNIIKEKDSNPTTYTRDIIDCYVQGHEYEDKQLNKVYKLVMASLDEKTKKNLLNEQRQWIKSRDVKSLTTSDGDKYKSYSKLVEMNGQMGELDHISTMYKLTKKRVEELTAMLNKLSTKNNDDNEFSYACFEPLYPWMSTDNYEVFYEYYFQKNYRDDEDFFYNKFTRKPGLYFGKEIQSIDEIQTGWDDPKILSFGTKLSTCETKERPVIIESETCKSSRGVAEIISEIDIKNRDYFLPNFKGTVNRLMVVKTYIELGADCLDGSGDFPEYDFAVYGIIESNNEEYIIPVKISFENGIKKFIESRNVKNL